MTVEKETIVAMTSDQNYDLDEPVDLDDHGHDNDEGDSIFSSIGRCMADENDVVYFTDSAIHLVVHCVDVHDDENCVTSGFVGRSFVGFPR